MKLRTFLSAAVLALAAASASADDSDIVFAAIQYGDLESLRAVLAENASLANATNASGMMPLHFAARVGRADAAGILLDAGADANATLAKSAGTPLHYAANVDAADVAELLLARGAKTGVRAVQWVGKRSVDASILMPDGAVYSGLIEDSVLSEKNDMVQLERIGFARIEKKSDKGVEMVFAHR
jgi:ankyrin repeat protein